MAVPDWHAKQGEKKIEQIMRPSLANTRLCFFCKLITSPFSQKAVAKWFE
jgi:hypothetical protein